MKDLYEYGVGKYFLNKGQKGLFIDWRYIETHLDQIFCSLNKKNTNRMTDICITHTQRAYMHHKKISYISTQLKTCAKDLIPHKSI